MKRYSFLLALLIIVFSFTLLPKDVFAEEERLWLHFSDEAIKRGYTAEFNQQSHPAWGDFRLAIVPDLVNEPVYLEMKQFDGNELPQPESLRPVSDYYIYDILREDQENKDPLILNKPFILSLKFNSDNLFRKKIHFWSKLDQRWMPLPSSADYVNGYIRAYTHLPFSRVAVFEDESELEGKASWYRSSRYRYGAACNNYPMGTMLRVRNVDSNKTVDVEVVSTGPFDPERVIDLILPAFEQIEERWKGLARVQVWPIEQEDKVLGVDTIVREPAPIIAEPNIQSEAVIAINEKTEEIIYSKNYDTKLPVASLTKLMTAAVFLDTNTPFEQVVTYEAGDSAVGSKLYVSPGETMTVKDLYYSMLVGSANNAANALARSTGLSREEFVRRMNEKASAWGLSNTHFVDVSGLDPANISTVYEIALMSKQILKDFRVLQGTTTPVYSFLTIDTDQPQPHTIKNSARGVFETKIIDQSLFITGMKTGYLDEAGYCFMLKARSDKDDDNHVITVVLGSDSNNLRYQESNALMEYALNRI